MYVAIKHGISAILPQVSRYSLSIGLLVKRQHVRLYAQMPPRRKINDSEVEENFLKGSGPGGQKINKTNSAVQLKHLPTGIVVKCQATRSRTQNREIARRLLGEKLEDIEQGNQSRISIKAATKQRKKASADKKKRRKYRKIEEGKIKIH